MLIKYVCGLTREYFYKRGFWGLNEADRISILFSYHSNLCRLYKVRVGLKFNLNMRFIFGNNGGGAYDRKTGIITMNTISLMTYIHEFRHALQNKKYKIPVEIKELDAQLWSHVVFRNSLPKLYKRNMENRKFYHYFNEEILEKAGGIYLNEK